MNALFVFLGFFVVVFCAGDAYYQANPKSSLPTWNFDGYTYDPLLVNSWFVVQRVNMFGPPWVANFTIYLMI